MRQPLFPKDAPIDEKRISFIETVVTRLMRRAKGRSVALITPYPISNAVFGDSVSGSILRYMFPCEGTVTTGLVRLGAKLKEGAKLTIHVFGDKGDTSRVFDIDTRTIGSELDVHVNSGDCLNVSVMPTDPNEVITEIWVSFLWVPTIRDVEVKSYLVDDLDKED